MPDQAPPPGSASNTDTPGAPQPGARPGQPQPAQSAGVERPDDIITIRDSAGSTFIVSRAQWDAMRNKGAYEVVNARAAGQPAGPPAPAAPQPNTVGLTPAAQVQWIKEYQRNLGRPLTVNDFEILSDPANGRNLGYLKRMEAPTQAELEKASPFGTVPKTVIEYSNGLKLFLPISVDEIRDPQQGVTEAHLESFDFTPPSKKSPTLEAVEIEEAKARAALGRANAKRQEDLNAGRHPTRESEAQIAQADATAAQARANTRKIESELASGKTEAEVAQIYSNIGVNTSQATTGAENAATNRGRLLLDTTVAEIERRYKEGLIDNETRRILSNHAWQRWQADNANTQTVVAAAGKGLEADLTERNQNIALDNTRTNAANTGFSDDTKTVTTMAQYIDPKMAQDILYNGLVGLAGLRKSTVQDWGGLQQFGPVRRPGVLEQLGYNTPVTLNSLPTVDDIERQKDDIRAGRRAAGLETQPVVVPTVTPTQVPVVTAPARPGVAPAAPARPVAPTPPPPRTAPLAPIYPGEGGPQSTLPPQPPDQPSQAYLTSNGLLLSSIQPVQFAQGGTPIAVRDPFGRTRPTRDRYAWLR